VGGLGVRGGGVLWSSEPTHQPTQPTASDRPTQNHQNRPPRSAALLQLLCAYADRYDALLEGRCEDMSLSELHGGARIRCGEREAGVCGRRGLPETLKRPA
jgi:hypothetical protein